jgi:hypothetical protein
MHHFLVDNGLFLSFPLENFQPLGNLLLAEQTVLHMSAQLVQVALPMTILFIVAEHLQVVYYFLRGQVFVQLRGFYGQTAERAIMLLFYALGAKGVRTGRVYGQSEDFEAN